jgi:predicted CoA-binding protein
VDIPCIVTLRGGSALNLKEMLKTVDTVLVIDWPNKEVPEMLALAGFRVVVRGGPGPEDYSAYELMNGEVVARHVGRSPERADLIYSFRPVSKLSEAIATAKDLHARTIWTQSGLSAAGVNDPKGCWVPEEVLRQARH